MGHTGKPDLPLTKLVHSGSLSYEGGRPLNPPVYRSSTVIFDSTKHQRDLKARRGSERLFTYGARGNPTNFALEDAIAELEGGHRTRLYPTGLAAMGMVLLAYLRPGDHVLITDGVYEPMRTMQRQFLERYGIAVDYFPPDVAEIEPYLKPETQMVYVECPSSLVFEMCDLPRICETARSRGIIVAADNTWGSGVQYRPLALGADVSIIAATKYLSGHSDVMMGAVTTTEAAWPALLASSDAFGMTVGADDAYLVLRGIRTLAPRITMHHQHALEVADWLCKQPQIAHVFCPALPQHRGHELWKRDCNGTNGLLSIELTGRDQQKADAFIDALRLFRIGASWGGYESLVTGTDMTKARTLSDWSRRGSVVRLHVGLECPNDLIADLAQALPEPG